ncbi:MAG: hypothetical protein AAGD01_11675 [Acidobacteriota bacterium]
MDSTLIVIAAIFALVLIYAIYKFSNSNKFSGKLGTEGLEFSTERESSGENAQSEQPEEVRESASHEGGAGRAVISGSKAGGAISVSNTSGGDAVVEASEAEGDISATSGAPAKKD